MDLLEKEFPSLSPKRNILKPRREVSTGLESGPNKDLGRFVIGKSRNFGEEYEGQDELKQRVADFIASSGLDVDMEVIGERLEKTTVSEHKSHDNYLGHYHPATRSAEIHKDNNASNEIREQTVVHELFHAASAQVLIKNLNLHEYTTTQVFGLGKGPEMFPIFQWLNEAVTETLSMKLLGSSESMSYAIERKALDEILTLSGIPLSVFLEAYFEEPQLGAEPGKRMPKWHTLQRQLNHSFGPRFLQRLDKHYDDLKDNPFGEDGKGVEEIVKMHDQWQDLVQKYGREKARLLILEQEREAALQTKAEMDANSDYDR